MSRDAIAFAIPGGIETRTGGYGYDRRLIGGLRAHGIAVDHLAWPGGFPAPTAEDLAAAARSLAGQPDGRVVIVDGLAYGAMPELAAAEGGCEGAGGRRWRCESSLHREDCRRLVPARGHPISAWGTDAQQHPQHFVVDLLLLLDVEVIHVRVQQIAPIGAMSASIE